MAIGVNWKEIWADVWGPVWVSTAPGNVTVQLTGQAIAMGQGTIVPDLVTALTGLGLTSEQGTVVPLNSPVLSGAEVSVSTGTIAASLTVSMTGSSAAFGQGSVFLASGDSTPPASRTVTVNVSLSTSINGPAIVTVH